MGDIKKYFLEWKLKKKKRKKDFLAGHGGARL